MIGYVWPEPNSSAAGSRMLALIELFLTQTEKVGGSVTFATPATDSEHAIDLESMGVHVKKISLNCSSFDTFITALQPELVLFDRFMMEEQFGWRVEKNCPKALRILNTEDLHCLRDARQRAHKQQREFQLDDLNSDMALREVAAILRSDISLIISSYEMKLLRTQFGVDESLLHYCPFMLDLNAMEPGLAFESRQNFMCIGNFRHAPNWDSVLWLKNEIWPLIRRQLPAVELHIYGAYPPKKATDLHNPSKGFHVMGWASNALEVMANARVCLAPLRFGAGIKGKLADAMRCGTPSVTTAVGAEAMWLGANSDWSGCVAETPETIAAAAVELYQNKERWQKAQTIGFATLNTHFEAGVVGELLLKKMNACRNALTAHRQNNFTGAMLRHHHQRSTQFMSQWIEVKNQLQSK